MGSMRELHQGIDALIKVLQEPYHSGMWPEFSEPLEQCQKALNKMRKHLPGIEKLIEIRRANSPAFIKEGAARNFFEDCRSYIAACEGLKEALDSMVDCVVPRLVAITAIGDSEQDKANTREAFKQSYKKAGLLAGNAWEHFYRLCQMDTPPIIIDPIKYSRFEEDMTKITQWTESHASSKVDRINLLKDANCLEALETQPPELAYYVVLFGHLHSFASQIEQDMTDLRKLRRPPPAPEYHI